MKTNRKQPTKTRTQGISPEYAASHARQLDELGHQVLDTWVAREEIDAKSIATFEALTGSTLGKAYLEHYIQAEIDEFLPAPLSVWFELDFNPRLALAEALTEQGGAPVAEGTQLHWVVR